MLQRLSLETYALFHGRMNLVCNGFQMTQLVRGNSVRLNLLFLELPFLFQYVGYFCSDAPLQFDTITKSM